MTAHDWDAIEREYRAGQLSIKELARQHKLSDTAIHKRAKAKGWTRDLSSAVRTRVRESLVFTARALSPICPRPWLAHPPRAAGVRAR